MIADNLGWYNYVGGFDGVSNIEENLEGTPDEVKRVSKEVFDLEKVYRFEYPTNDGEIDEIEK